MTDVTKRRQLFDELGRFFSSQVQSLRSQGVGTGDEVQVHCGLRGQGGPQQHVCKRSPSPMVYAAVRAVVVGGE